MTRFGMLFRHLIRTASTLCFMLTLCLATGGTTLALDTVLFGGPHIAYAETRGEKNATLSAKEWLKSFPYSKKGLVDMLKSDGFTAAEAKYGVENCGANWKKQAARYAKELLDSYPYSKKALIAELKNSGFTTSQAKYGAEKVYV